MRVNFKYDYDDLMLHVEAEIEEPDPVVGMGRNVWDMTVQAERLRGPAARRMQDITDILPDEFLEILEYEALERADAGDFDATLDDIRYEEEQDRALEAKAEAEDEAEDEAKEQSD